MGFRMKNFNIIGVHWKIQFLGGGWRRGGRFTKNKYIRGITQKGGLRQFAVLREEAWQKRVGGGVFEWWWVDTPMYIMTRPSENYKQLELKLQLFC